MATPLLTVSSLKGKDLFKLPEALLERLNTALLVLDRDFKLYLWTPNFIDLLNRYTALSVDRLVAGVNLFELLPETARAWRPLLEQALAGETAYCTACPLNFTETTSYWDVGVELTGHSGQNCLVVTITDITEQVLSRQKLEQELADRSRRLSAFLKVSHNLLSLEAEPLLDLILDELKRVVDYDAVWVTSLREEMLVVTAFRGPVPPERAVGWQLPLQESAVGQMVIRHAEPLIIPDINADTAQARAFRAAVGDRLETALGHARCWLAIPMLIKERVTGILGLQHRQPNYYTAHHAELALAFAHFVAIALENGRLVQQARHLATLEERHRLAQELHDNLAQALGYLNLKLSTTRTLLADGQLEAVRTNLRELKEIVGDTYTDVREEIFNLRGQQVQGLSFLELKEIVGDTYTDVREEIFNLRGQQVQGLSFLEMLHQYVAKYKQHYDLKIELILESDETLLNFPTSVSSQVIRIIQEALINVRKHAGVNQALLRFRQVGHEIHISIEDAGRGFDASQLDRRGTSGFGLQIMAERAESAGGRLTLETTPGGGAKVIIQVPIQNEKVH